MDRSLREHVRSRAGGRCEYCYFPESGHEEKFSIDHVIARKHGGNETAENLALSCLRCNLHKGTNLSGIDPETGNVVQLFNPRGDKWQEHFRLNGTRMVGLTAVGRASVAVMNMNAPERIQLRRTLQIEGALD